MTRTTDNKVCVRVDTDSEGRKFMDVTLPEFASVTISKEGTVWVNVNDSCVFRLCKPGQITVENNYGTNTRP